MHKKVAAFWYDMATDEQKNERRVYKKKQTKRMI